MGTDSYDEMHRFLTGDDCSDQLLSGRLSALDTPEPLRGVAALFEAAAGPAAPQELTRRSQVVAAVTAEVLSSQPQLPFTPSRRKAMLSKILTAKFAAAATAAAFGLGTAAAAATGSLPGQTDNANTHATTSGLTTAAANQTSHGNSNGHGNAQSHGASAGHTTGSGGSASTGPANQHAQFGLCTAYLATHTSSTSSTSLPQDNSTAFKALSAAANQQNESTSAYCTTVVSQHNSSGDTSDATEPSESGKPANTGKPATTPTKPADAGTPPSTAGSSQGHAAVTTPNDGAGTGTAASNGSNTTGATSAGTASSGASTAGSGNATTHP